MDHAAYRNRERGEEPNRHYGGPRRVPIANACELRQVLEDRRVPVEMVVYKGFDHGITKPKVMRAVMTHNLAWLNRYVFGDPALDLARTGVPKKEAKDKDEEKKAAE